jgi:hypothetical protein
MPQPNLPPFHQPLSQVEGSHGEISQTLDALLLMEHCLFC